MSGDPVEVILRGCVYEGAVYFRAEDVITSLRLTAEGYRNQASDENDEMVVGVLGEVALLFESEADEFDVISMELLTDDIEEQACQTDEADTVDQ